MGFVIFLFAAAAVGMAYCIDLYVKRHVSVISTSGKCYVVIIVSTAPLMYPGRYKVAML